jgi:hypothetical protein
MSDFMETLPVRAGSSHMGRRKDRQTGMTKLIVALCSFVDMPKTNVNSLDRMWKEVAVNYFKALSQYRTKLEEPSIPIHETTAVKKNGARHCHE